MYFDSHAHYSDSAFAKDRAAVLKSLKAGGVDYVVECGADIKSSREALKMSQQYDFVYCAVGIHPESVGNLDEEDVTRLYNIAADAHKVVAIGEIGLDYHYDNNPKKDVQQEWFIEQIELAKELELPIIVHSRDAAQDTFDILEDYDGGMYGGVLHSYTGAPEMAKRYVDMGFYLGIGGMVTFSNAKKVVATVEQIPLEHLLIETDCPYLAPVPMRGKRNDSRNLQYIVERIAQIKQIAPEEVARVTTENAKKLFGIKK